MFWDTPVSGLALYCMPSHKKTGNYSYTVSWGLLFHIWKYKEGCTLYGHTPCMYAILYCTATNQPVYTLIQLYIQCKGQAWDIMGNFGLPQLGMADSVLLIVNNNY